MSGNQTIVAKLTLWEEVVHYYYFHAHLYPDQIAPMVLCSTAAVVRILKRIEGKLGKA